MDEGKRASEAPIGAPIGTLGRALPCLGFAAIATLALAWTDHIPGSWFLHGLVAPASSASNSDLAAHAAERLTRFAAENARAAPDAIVFVGSSTIERFPLESCFPGKPCVNRGILSASARLLEHFAGVLVPKIPRGALVVYSGSIDLRAPILNASGSANADRVEAAAANVRSLLDTLRTNEPTAAIALIGVMPARHMTAADVQELARLNARLREIARERGIAFVDTARAPISSPNGSLAEDHSVDDLHLDERGYATLAAWLVADGGEVGRRLAP